MNIKTIIEQRRVKNKKHLVISTLIFFIFSSIILIDFNLALKKEFWGFLVLLFSFLYSKNTFMYHFKLKKLLNIIKMISKEESVSTKQIEDLLKFRKFFIVFSHNHKDRLKIEGETMDFIAFFVRYLLILNDLKNIIKNLDNINLHLIEMKFISDREGNNFSSIYTVKFENKHILTYLLPYKYENERIKEMINLLLTNKVISYSFLKNEGASEDDIYYCKKKLGEWWSEY